MSQSSSGAPPGEDQPPAGIGQRKHDHLDLTARGDVGFRETTTLFECVRLVHDALPELGVDDLDLECRLFGKTLRAPLLIAAMTGGTERAGTINRQLAQIAESRGIALGLGSQRPMLRDRAAWPSYQLRELAPTTVILGNLGVVQARESSTAEIEELVEATGVDALCVHLNPAMELIQDEGDRDFRGCIDTLGRLVSELSVPVIAKETGCGISRRVGERLRAVGVEHVDVSGAGGTSWVAVETHRASPGRRRVGEAFREWGIPTAASVALLDGLGFETVFATGGVSSGLDVAKALALGASAGGIARPVLQALDQGGVGAAEAFLAAIELELRTALLLTGSRTPGDLRRGPRLLTGELRDWLRSTP